MKLLRIWKNDWGKKIRIWTTIYSPKKYRFVGGKINSIKETAQKLGINYECQRLAFCALGLFIL